MDINALTFVNNLPAGSKLKTALATVVLDADDMSVTDELFNFINAYEQTQTAFNAGEQPEKINTIRPGSTEQVRLVNGVFTRSMTKTVAFVEQFSSSAIEPSLSI